MLYSVDSLFVFLLGFIAVSCIVIKTLFSKTKISPIPFYIILGIVGRELIGSYQLKAPAFHQIITVFGDIGLILILFQVGIESHIKELFRQIKNAILISIPEVIISGLFVFFAIYLFLDVPLHIAALIGIAFTATSIAVTVTIWRDSGSLNSESGKLQLDLSAMDDIAGITLMVVAFSYFSSLKNPSHIAPTFELFISLATVGAELFLLILLAYLFSIYVEPKLTTLIKRYEVGPDPAVTITCLALIFSALVGFFGLSIALGSFLLGLAFSRDAAAVQELATYRSLESFFIPFFFFSIGFSTTALFAISPMAVIILFLAALFGKVVGVGAPAHLLKLPFASSMLVALSMVPRAEISLVVMAYGKQAFDIPDKLYSEAILVILITCFFPLILQPLIRKAAAKQII